MSQSRLLISALLCFLVAALLVVQLAHGQTAPAPTVCGYAHPATPTAVLLASGSAAAYASQSVANTTASAAPTKPTLRLGVIVGAIVDVEQTGIRFRVDGTTISGTFDGTPVPAGATLQVCGADVTTWSAIASSTGSNAILRWRWLTTGGG